jgi:hypothetical protein
MSKIAKSAKILVALAEEADNIVSLLGGKSFWSIKEFKGKSENKIKSRAGDRTWIR